MRSTHAAAARSSASTAALCVGPRPGGPRARGIRGTAASAGAVWSVTKRNPLHGLAETAFHGFVVVKGALCASLVRSARRVLRSIHRSSRLGAH